MNQLSLGQKVLVDGRRGVVGALSGSDQQCLVRFEDGKVSGWLPQERPLPVVEAVIPPERQPA